MTAHKPRIRRNQSRIEFLANKETVISFLEQGFDKKRIFERLQEKDAISMAYPTFCKIFAKFLPCKSQPKAHLSLPAETKPSLPVPQGNSVPAASRSGPQILGKMHGEPNPADPNTYDKNNLI